MFHIIRKIRKTQRFPDHILSSQKVGGEPKVDHVVLTAIELVRHKGRGVWWRKTGLFIAPLKRSLSGRGKQGYGQYERQ